MIDPVSKNSPSCTTAPSERSSSSPKVLPQTESRLSSLKESKKPGICGSIWNFIKATWHGLYSMAQKIVRLIFLRCCYQEEDEKDELTLHHTQWENYSLERKIEVFKELPQEIQLKILPIENRKEKLIEAAVKELEHATFKKILLDYKREKGIELMGKLKSQLKGPRHNEEIFFQLPRFLIEDFLKNQNADISFAKEPFEKAITTWMEQELSVLQAG